MTTPAELLRQCLTALEDDGDGHTTLADDIRAFLAAPALEPVAVHQFRKPHCAEWHDGLPDPYDGGGPYEERTLYLQPAAPAPAVPELETRADGQQVRVDRWEWGIRRIVALLWGNRKSFEIDEVVEAVRVLSPTPNEDDEGLCSAVQKGYGSAPSSPPPVALSDELALIVSVLKGYPPSMARSDALRACAVIEAAHGIKQGGQQPVGLSDEQIVKCAEASDIRTDLWCMGSGSLVYSDYCNGIPRGDFTKFVRAVESELGIKQGGQQT